MHRIIFSIGPFTLYSYGLMISIGAVTAVLLASFRAGREGLNVSDIMDVFTALILGGIVGGRGLFVVLNMRYFLERPLEIFYLTDGGMAFQGGLLLALFFAALVCSKKKLSFLKVADLFIPYAVLAHSIGRIGCFLNGCCYGAPAGRGFMIMFPGDATPRIPTQIYSSIGLSLIFLLLLRLRRKKPFDGYLLAVYLVIYPVFRAAMDLLRGDGLLKYRGVTVSQFISAGMLSAGIALYFFLKGRAGRRTTEIKTSKEK